MKFAHQHQRLAAARCDQYPESLVVRQIAQHPRIVRVVFDDQQNQVVGLQIFTIVRNLLHHRLGDIRRSQLQWGSRLQDSPIRRNRNAG
jgi:hypothetical protein